MRVAVVGPGSIGCFFAAHLSATEHDVVAYARRAFDAYRVDSPESPITGPAAVTTDPSQLGAGTAHWVLVGITAHHGAGAAPWLHALGGPETKGVAMQNCTEAVERLRPFVNGAEVVQAVADCCAELIEPRHIAHSGMGRLIMPEIETERLLEAPFEGTAIVLEVTSAHQNRLWFKLSLNSVANGLTALTGKTMEVLAAPAMFGAATESLAEAWRVSTA